MLLCICKFIEKRKSYFLQYSQYKILNTFLGLAGFKDLMFMLGITFLDLIKLAS